MIKCQKIVWDHFQIWKCFTVSKSENASTAVFKSTNTSKVFFSNQKMLQLQTPPPIWGTVPWPPHGAIPVPWTPKGLFSLTPTRGNACFPWPPQGAVPVSLDPHKGQCLFPVTPTRGNTCFPDPHKGQHLLTLPGKGKSAGPTDFFSLFSVLATLLPLPVLLWICVINDVFWQFVHWCTAKYFIELLMYHDYV